MSKLKLVEGQVIAQIDTTQVFASERPGSGFIFLLDMDGKAVLNGQEVPVGFAGSNMGTSECFEDFAEKIAKLLVPYSITPEMIGLDDEMLEIEGQTLTEAVVAFIAEGLDVGDKSELVFKNGELEMLVLESVEGNYTSEEELEDEEDEDFELGEDDEDDK